MAITFTLYEDAGLTILADTSLAITAESDLSDGYHDFQFYFGSTTADVMLRASSNPGVDPIQITPTYILQSRASSTAYVLGDSAIPSPANGYRYEVTTAGTSGGSAPTWNTSLGSTTTDGTVVWTLVAEDSPTSEIKLALTQAGLDSATGGAALTLGTTLLSEPSNAVEFWVRVTNTITQPSESVGTPELGVNINGVVEQVQ
jgi:hypothetical protein